MIGQKLMNEARTFFERALQLAHQAKNRDEIPIGAVLVQNGEVIAEAHNQTEKDSCFISHAEILVIQKACQKLKTKYLINCSLYVTVEPCRMCFTAAQLSRISQVFFLIPSHKYGENGNAYPSIEKCSGNFDDLANQQHEMLQSFFQIKR